MTTPTEDRLNELLELKDRALNEAHAENNRLEHQLRFGVDWMLHDRSEAEDEVLPRPRLEVTICENTDYHVESMVTMVLDERGGEVLRVPMGYSKRSGSGIPVDEFPSEGDVPAGLISYLPSLLHDACFYCEKTSLPLYVVLDEDHVYRVVNLRPLTLASVD